MGPYTQKPNSVIETAFFNLNYMEAKSGRNFRKIGPGAEPLGAKPLGVKPFGAKPEV